MTPEADHGPKKEPKPPTFDALPLSADVRKAVDELGYVHPTPVQRAVFEPATRGLDLVVQARTGTGKTAAFGLPMVDVLVKRGTPKVQALVLCPTRELAVQVTKEISALGKHRGIHVAAVYGGAPMAKQVKAIQEGAQVVVGTPGRILDHLRRGTLEPRTVRMLVLDESDEMLSMGFLPQITDILSQLPESRQTLLFSATLPADIQRVAETRLKNPHFISLSGDHVGALEILHVVYLVRGDKVADLIKVLETEDPESAIIFCNTRDDTKRVAGALQQQGYDADWLNADLSQADREKVMDATRQGKLRFLVATDVAARGIDISHLTHVINFGFPEAAEQYVHRTGRTGRAGRTGTAISLVEASDIGNLYYLRLTYKIRPIERQLPSRQDLKTRAEMDVVQMFIDLFARRTAHPDDLALARRLLTHEDAERVVAGLVRDHLGAIVNPSDQASAARRARLPAPAPKGVPSATVSAAEPPPKLKGQLKPTDGASSDTGGAKKLEKERSREPRRRPPEPRITPAQKPDSELPEVPFDVAEIFVNVGRKDGAKASDFYAVLAERAGITIDDTGYVNVRQRHAFIGVKREHLERAVNALNGALIAGREAMAEPARPRPPHEH